MNSQKAFAVDILNIPDTLCWPTKVCRHRCLLPNRTTIVPVDVGIPKFASKQQEASGPWRKGESAESLEALEQSMSLVASEARDRVIGAAQTARNVGLTPELTHQEEPWD